MRFPEFDGLVGGAYEGWGRVMKYGRGQFTSTITCKELRVVDCDDCPYRLLMPGKFVRLSEIYPNTSCSMKSVEGV
jgi:hypothetical protein